MKKFKLLLAHILLTGTSQGAMASIYLAGGYDEGPCSDAGCTCIADDLQSEGVNNYCLDWGSPGAPFVKLQSQQPCPQGADGPMSQRRAIALFFDRDISEVHKWPEQLCNSTCDTSGGNCHERMLL
jgi:hypothetical protein